MPGDSRRSQGCSATAFPGCDRPHRWGGRVARNAGLYSMTRTAILLLSASALACFARSPRSTAPAPLPRIVQHSEWQTQPPVGHAAEANRRNLKAGDSLVFRGLTLAIVSTERDSTGDIVRLRLKAGANSEDQTVREGAAFNWNAFHVAVVAIYGPGELGAGLVALEIGTLNSLPSTIAASTQAGGASNRLRIPHRITHVTLHHVGSAEPLRAEDDPRQKLQGLQAWGERDRNWWDVPYHYLIDLEGRIYEGRDWRYMGETNTTYDPAGHFLISIIGNYERQEPTQAQIESIADLMAWAVTWFDVPLDRIGGHYNYADTGCPGRHLRKYLEDGTLRRMVAVRTGRQ